MKKNILSTNEATQLRENAKEVLELRKRANPNDLSKLPLNNILETVHELQVHQIELEMQNEELRALHLEIETARTRYFELYDLAPVGYCTLSDRGIILEANLTAATLLGVNRGALFQRPMSRYIWIEDQDLYFHQIKALLQTKKQQTFQIRFKKSDESLFYAHLVLSLDIHNGEVKQIKLTMSDCSEIKRLEEQLQQSQKMELIGRLAGGVAHDFNNMLAVILGNVERSLSSLTVSDPTYQSMIEIQEAAERSVLMTRQLLGFARKQMIQPQILNINTQIEKTISILKRLVGENIEITTEFEEGLGSIQIDCSQLDQILTNLCVNARDAIVGQGKIHLSTQKKYLEDKSAFEGCIPGFYVCLSIKDNGSGIDPSVQKRLFEPFLTTKPIGKGTGLGLSMIYGIVRQNHGDIRLMSSSLLGTTFHLYFPCCERVAVSVKEEVNSESSKRREGVILVVEDEPALLMVIQLMLESSGYTVLTATSPLEAIKIAQRDLLRIGLIVTDVQMPEMNGMELSRQIKEILPRMPFLFLTGYNTEDLSVLTHLDREIQMIQKPFTKKTLLAHVDPFFVI